VAISSVVSSYGIRDCFGLPTADLAMTAEGNLYVWIGPRDDFLGGFWASYTSLYSLKDTSNVPMQGPPIVLGRVCGLKRRETDSRGGRQTAH